MFIKKFLILITLIIFTGVSMAENTKEKLLIELSHGDVLIELHSDIAPLHVEQIKTLARDGFYDGIIFHRVIDGFMAQTGDPTGTGMGGSDYPNLKAEFSTKPFERGTVGMARSRESIEVLVLKIINAKPQIKDSASFDCIEMIFFVM